MFSTKKPSSVVGLDLETGSMAATEVRGNGSSHASRTAIEPLEPGVVVNGEVRDSEALSKFLRSAFARHKLSKEVRLGIANQQVVMRTLRLPLIEDPEEIDTAVRFQAQDQLPMPLDQAILDHEVVGRQAGPEGERHMDVLAVAARRDMVASLAASLRDAGLRPVGIDLAAFGMIRALSNGAGPQDAAPEAVNGELPAPATLYCNLGDITNLAVARGGSCLFARVANFGIASIAERLSERDEFSVEAARPLLFEVGLEQPLDGFEEPGRAEAVREVLEEGCSKLIDELRATLESYGGQEGAAAIERIVISGRGSTIPGLPQRIETGLGLGIEAQIPGALDHLDDEDAARLTVSYGLALGG